MLPQQDGATSGDEEDLEMIREARRESQRQRRHLRRRNRRRRLFSSFNVFRMNMMQLEHFLNVAGQTLFGLVFILFCLFILYALALATASEIGDGGDDDARVHRASNATLYNDTHPFE